MGNWQICAHLHNVNLYIHVHVHYDRPLFIVIIQCMLWSHTCICIPLLLLLFTFTLTLPFECSLYFTLSHSLCELLHVTKRYYIMDSWYNIYYIVHTCIYYLHVCCAWTKLPNIHCYLYIVHINVIIVM